MSVHLVEDEQLYGSELALLSSDPVSLDCDGRAAFLAAAARLRAWVDAREAEALAACRAADDAAATGAVGVAELVKRAGGVSGQAAARRVRTADALASLPVASAALAGGEISHDHAAVLGALWDDLSHDVQARLMADEPEVVDHARSCSPEAFRHYLAAWHRSVDEVGADRLAEKRRKRAKASQGHDDDGMGWLHAALAPEELATVVGVLDGLVDELWRAQRSEATRADAVPAEVRTNAQLRADAMVEMAKRARGATAADARKVQPACHVLIDLDTIMSGLHDHSLCTLSDGTPLGVNAARRLACEAGIIPHVLGSDGRPLNVGHKQRLATPAQRDALRVQYRGCCGIRGCEVPFDYCAIHHIVWWEHGGPTDLVNLLPLCSRHHHFVHDGGWTLREVDVGAYTLDPPVLTTVGAA